MRYAVVIEKADGNYSAYVPDLPGCVATGATVEEVEREIRDAIAFHIEGMREDGLPIPEPTSKLRKSTSPRRDSRRGRCRQFERKSRMADRTQTNRTNTGEALGLKLLPSVREMRMGRANRIRKSFSPQLPASSSRFGAAAKRR